MFVVLRLLKVWFILFFDFQIPQLWENRVVKIPKTYLNSRLYLAWELELVIADTKLLLWDVSCTYCMFLSSNTATLFRFD